LIFDVARPPAMICERRKPAAASLGAEPLKIDKNVFLAGTVGRRLARFFPYPSFSDSKVAFLCFSPGLWAVLVHNNRPLSRFLTVTWVFLVFFQSAESDISVTFPALIFPGALLIFYIFCVYKIFSLFNLKI
jgi:hypothetical protein